uniref:Uncharacterized protein n=1 Tax=Rhizophora mucronata TaxID=61149 RepID=A0A2P2N4N5_RHIMU
MLQHLVNETLMWNIICLLYITHGRFEKTSCDNIGYSYFDVRYQEAHKT